MPKRETKGKDRSLGQKCKSFFAAAADPFNGGMKVILPKPSWDTSGDDEQIYTRSYYHWEFIMHLQKIIMQVMVVYMYDVRQSLQGILLLILCLAFLVI